VNNSPDIIHVFCTWVCAVVGAVTLSAFTVYFVVIVMKLVREALVHERRTAPVHTPIPRTQKLERSVPCPQCGHPLGPVKGAEVGGELGTREVRFCTQCQQQMLVPSSE